MSRAALEEGKCVVIGLQSTGEARTADVVAERGEILDDYVSGPRVGHASPLPSLTSRLICLYALLATDHLSTFSAKTPSHLSSRQVRPHPPPFCRVVSA